MSLLAKQIKRWVTGLVVLSFIIGGTSFVLAAQKGSKTSKKSKKVASQKKKSSRPRKKGAGKPSKKRSQAGSYYVVPLEENLRSSPSGKRIGSIVQGTPVKVNKIRGNWALVTVNAWIWKPSLSRSKPRQSEMLLVGDVKGTFQKGQFIIKGTLKNQTKVDFAKVVLQGELFKRKKRVAYKTLTLFSKKKPLRAGKTYVFSIVFKRSKGFDSYGVRILSASEK